MNRLIKRLEDFKNSIKIIHFLLVINIVKSYFMNKTDKNQKSHELLQLNHSLLEGIS